MALSNTSCTNTTEEDISNVHGNAQKAGKKTTKKCVCMCVCLFIQTNKHTNHKDDQVEEHNIMVIDVNKMNTFQREGGLKAFQRCNECYGNEVVH